MPFAPNYKDQEQQGQGNGQPAGQNISGVSSSFNVPGAGGSSSGSSQKSSGQYQNLDKYINANQQQGAQMGQNVANKVEGDIGQAQQSVAGLQNQVQKTSAYDPNQAISKATQLSDQEKKTYKDTKQTGGYTGPSDVTGLSGYSDAYNASEKAKSEYGNVGNELGQQNLLKQTYDRANYTQGANKLDQVLLQGSTQGKQAIQSLSDKYKGLNDQFSNAFSGAQTDISNSLAQAKANRDAIASSEAKTMNDFTQGLNERAQQQNALNVNNQNLLRNDLSDNKLTQSTLSQLGLNAGDQLWGLNLNNYLNYDQTPMTANTVATADERAKYSALNDLFDQNGNYLTSNNPLQDFKAIQFNKDKFSADQMAAKKAYENAYGSSHNYNGSWFSNGQSIDSLNAADSLDELNRLKSIPGYSDQKQSVMDKLQAKIDAVNSQYKFNDKILTE